MTNILTTREQFASLKPPTKLFPIPDTDVSVYIRMFTVGQRLQVTELCQSDDKNKVLSIVALSISDADGNLLFEPGNTQELDNLSIQAMNDMMEEILAFNKMGPGSNEDLVKNSEAAPSGEPSSPSPES